MFLKLSSVAGSQDHLYNYLVKETIGGIAQGQNLKQKKQRTKSLIILLVGIIRYQCFFQQNFIDVLNNKGRVEPPPPLADISAKNVLLDGFPKRELIFYFRFYGVFFCLFVNRPCFFFLYIIRKCRHLTLSYKILSQNKCVLCGKFSKDRSNMRKHVENIHFPNSYIYHCKYCAETFGTRNSLNLHISKQHNKQ